MMRMGLMQFFGDYPEWQVIGYAVDGYMGIEQALKLNPDLIIMDIGLPHLDGIAATRKIKENLVEARVVILTSHQNETEMIAALASGADACCIKGTSLKQRSLAINAAQQGATYLDPIIARSVIQNIKIPAPTDNTAIISPREIEVLKLIVEGKSNAEIAQLPTFQTYS